MGVRRGRRGGGDAAARRSCAAARRRARASRPIRDGPADRRRRPRRSGCISSISSRDRPALAALVAEHAVADLDAVELGDPVGLISSPILVRMTMSASSPIVAQRLERAAAPRSGGASRASKKPSSSGQIRSCGTGSPVAVGRARRRSSAPSSVKSIAMRLRRPSRAKCGIEVEQHLVAIGDQQRPAHALPALRRAATSAAGATPSASAQAIRSGSCASRKREHRGEQSPVARAARAARRGSARSARAAARRARRRRAPSRARRSASVSPSFV